MDEIFYELDPSGDVMLVLQNGQDEALNGESIEVDNPQRDKATTRSDTSAKHDKEPVLMRLSSRHLALASDYFRNMLRGGWKNTTEFSHDQPLVISEKGWEVEPFLILMNIIHGRTKEIPRNVTRKLLTEIATLVDYYKCTEVVGFTAETWIQRLDSHLPRTFSGDIVEWIWISYVFREPRIFKMMTEIALRQSRGPIQANGLPIPGTIVTELGERKLKSIDNVVKSLYRRIAKLQAEKHTCSFECRCGSLGALTIGMHKLDLLPPRQDFTGLNLKEVVESLRQLEYPRRATFCISTCIFNLQATIGSYIKISEGIAAGLDLNDFGSV